MGLIQNAALFFSLAKNYFFYPWQCGTMNLEDYDEYEDV